MHTAENFMAATSFVERRGNRELTLIDQLLLEHQRTNYRSVRKEILSLMNIVNACWGFLNKKSQNRKVSAIIELHYEAITEIEYLVNQRVTWDSPYATKRGWARVKAAVPVLFKGANSQTRTLRPDYWQEALNKDHFALRRDPSDPFESWKKSDAVQEHHNDWEYIEWVRNHYLPKLISDGNTKELFLRFFNNVKYLGWHQREEKQLHIKNGVFYNSLGERFHTGTMQTNAAGAGWGIYVRDPANKIYAHSHKVHAFHHSSFLSGAPVNSAGEIAVHSGKLIGITNKSGHYQPELRHFLGMLDYLHAQGVVLSGVAACASPSRHDQEFYDADEVRRTRGIRGTRKLKKVRAH
ncbi:hypothetical protein KC131_24180 [Pseudomonas sp. JQ170]|uniref:hypothetical protein n=1 Tax=unclassified Pseudomonas TaxID=196821 RepID=UPI0026526E94|nr:MULTISPECIES: hypothetical protein [unclassified Pseudomonas]MDN7143753.1 hypothetical protein [Pseudomonas sp. JQ170]WRO75379.1 hypothetical protein U9R80_23290 [Pseudomonas sp. 170C]